MWIFPVLCVTAKVHALIISTLKGCPQNFTKNPSALCCIIYETITCFYHIWWWCDHAFHVWCWWPWPLPSWSQNGMLSYSCHAVRQTWTICRLLLLSYKPRWTDKSAKCMWQVYSRYSTPSCHMSSSVCGNYRQIIDSVKCRCKLHYIKATQWLMAPGLAGAGTVDGAE